VQLLVAADTMNNHLLFHLWFDVCIPCMACANMALEAVAFATETGLQGITLYIYL
jgi:hypothetical protein